MIKKLNRAIANATIGAPRLHTGHGRPLPRPAVEQWLEKQRRSAMPP